MMYRYGFGWLGMLLGGFVTLLVLVALIALAVFIFRALVRSGSGAGSNRPANVPPTGAPEGAPAGETGDRALAILRERYAKGEINKEEYDSMRRDLAG